jgi:RNA polymerase sigma factor (sigma-70 family)
MPDPREDFDLGDLVDACRDGDQSAWTQLVSEFSPLVYSIPRRSGFSQEESEDVVQTVFALLVRKLDSIEDPQALPKWLSVTTQRACWREVRSGRARRAREADGEGPRPYETIESVADAEYHAEVLRVALQEIGERCERLLRALFTSGRGGAPAYEKVSEATGMPVGSIGPTRARCLRRLTRSLADDPAGRELLERFGPDTSGEQGK